MGLGSNIMVDEWRAEGEGWSNKRISWMGPGGGGEVDKEGRRRLEGREVGVLLVIVWKVPSVSFQSPVLGRRTQLFQDQLRHTWIQLQNNLNLSI